MDETKKPEPQRRVAGVPELVGFARGEAHGLPRLRPPFGAVLTLPHQLSLLHGDRLFLEVVYVKRRPLAPLGREALDAQHLTTLVPVHSGEGQRRAIALGDLVRVLV